MKEQDPLREYVIMGNSKAQTLSMTSGNSGGDITIWDAATVEELMNLGAHDSWITAVAFSPDGRV